MDNWFSNPFSGGRSRSTEDESLNRRAEAQVSEDERNANPRRDASFGAADRGASVYDMARGSAESTFRDYMDVDDTMMRQDARSRLAMENGIDSIMSLTARGASMGRGLEIPKHLADKFNRDNNFDGKTTGIVGGGFMPNGNFAIRFANGVGQDGNVVTRDQVFDPLGQYARMQRNTSAYDFNTRNALRAVLKRNGYSDRELDRFVVQQSPGTSVPGSWLGQSRPTGISAFSADGRGGGSRMDWTPQDGRSESDWGTRSLSNDDAANWSVVMSGPGRKDGSRQTVYRNRVTGETYAVQDGEDAPWVARAKMSSSGRTSPQDRLAFEKFRQDSMNERQARDQAFREKQAAASEDGRNYRENKRVEAMLEKLKAAAADKKNAQNAKKSDAVLRTFERLSKQKKIVGEGIDQKTVDKYDRQTALEMASEIVNAIYGANEGQAKTEGAKTEGAKTEGGSSYGLDFINRLISAFSAGGDESTGEGTAKPVQDDSTSTTSAPATSVAAQNSEPGEEMEIVTAKDGTRWQIVRDGSGRAIGKKRIK